MTDKSSKQWSWRGLIKRHKINYESESDRTLLDSLIQVSLKVWDYLSLSTHNLARALQKSSSSLWLTFTVILILIALLHINSDKILTADLITHLSSLKYQVVIGFIFFIFIYKVKKLLNLLWLICGPDLRWLKTFLTLELVTVLVSSYSLLPDSQTNIANGVSILTAGSAILIALLGSLRQFRFDRRLILKSRRSELIVDRASAENFDIMGQKGSTRRLKGIIENERGPNTPITVLMDGKWGDGKTYVVNRVLDGLEDLHKDYLIVRFEPWRHVSEEAIVTSFYGTLGSKISELPGSTGVQFDMAALSRNFVSKIDKSGTIEALLTQFPQKASSLNGLKNANKLITDSGKRLIFVIDDVERCGDKDRMLRTLQLGLHLGSDIKNSTTIIIGDIQEIIKQTDINESFLQKVVDEQITVLPPTKKEMLSITNALMKDLSFDISITQDQRLDLLMRNIRGIKRVLNGLNQDYIGIGNNIHPQDIFTMNVLKHAYPSLYSDIMQNKKFYVPFQYSDYSDEEFLIYGFGGEKEDSDFIKDQVEHFNELLAKLELSDIYRRRLVSVLEDIFPATKHRFDGGLESNNNTYARQHRRERRIGVSKDYIDRYFLLSNDVDKRHIIEDSQAEVRESYFNEDDDSIRLSHLGSIIDVKDKDDEELFYGGLTDSLADLYHDDPNRKVLGRDMLRLYFQDTNYVVRDDKRTLLIILNAINTYIDQEDYSYIFENVADYMRHPSTGLRLLLYINPTRDNSFYDLKAYPEYNKLRKEILLKVDRYYLDQNNDIIDEDNSKEREWQFTIAQWSTSVCCDNQDEFVPHRFNRVNNYLMTITGDSVEKFHTLLMAAFWHQDIMDKKSKFNFKITPQAYDAEKFAKQARKLLKLGKLGNDVQKDFQSFLMAYRDFKESLK